MRRLARANIDIEMSDVERARFAEAVGNYKPNGLVWSNYSDSANWQCDMIADE